MEGGATTQTTERLFILIMNTMAFQYFISCKLHPSILATSCYIELVFVATGNDNSHMPSYLHDAQGRTLQC